MLGVPGPARGDAPSPSLAVPNVPEDDPDTYELAKALNALLRGVADARRERRATSTDASPLSGQGSSAISPRPIARDRGNGRGGSGAESGLTRGAAVKTELQAGGGDWGDRREELLGLYRAYLVRARRMQMPLGGDGGDAFSPVSPFYAPKRGTVALSPQLDVSSALTDAIALNSRMASGMETHGAELSVKGQHGCCPPSFSSSMYGVGNGTAKDMRASVATFLKHVKQLSMVVHEVRDASDSLSEAEDETAHHSNPRGPGEVSFGNPALLTTAPLSVWKDPEAVLRGATLSMEGSLSGVGGQPDYWVPSRTMIAIDSDAVAAAAARELDLIMLDDLLRLERERELREDNIPRGTEGKDSRSPVLPPSITTLQAPHRHYPLQNPTLVPLSQYIAHQVRLLKHSAQNGFIYHVLFMQHASVAKSEHRRLVRRSERVRAEEFQRRAVGENLGGHLGSIVSAVAVQHSQQGSFIQQNKLAVSRTLSVEARGRLYHRQQVEGRRSAPIHSLAEWYEGQSNTARQAGGASMLQHTILPRAWLQYVMLARAQRVWSSAIASHHVHVQRQLDDANGRRKLFGPWVELLRITNAWAMVRRYIRGWIARRQARRYREASDLVLRFCQQYRRVKVFVNAERAFRKGVLSAQRITRRLQARRDGRTLLLHMQYLEYESFLLGLSEPFSYVFHSSILPRLGEVMGYLVLQGNVGERCTTAEEASLYRAVQMRELLGLVRAYQPVAVAASWGGANTLGAAGEPAHHLPSSTERRVLVATDPVLRHEICCRSRCLLMQRRAAALVTQSRLARFAQWSLDHCELDSVAKLPRELDEDGGAPMKPPLPPSPPCGVPMYYWLPPDELDNAVKYGLSETPLLGEGLDWGDGGRGEGTSHGYTFAAEVRRRVDMAEERASRMLDSDGLLAFALTGRSTRRGTIVGQPPPLHDLYVAPSEPPSLGSSGCFVGGTAEGHACGAPEDVSLGIPSSRRETMSFAIRRQTIAAMSNRHVGGFPRAAHYNATNSAPVNGASPVRLGGGGSRRATIVVPGDGEAQPQEGPKEGIVQKEVSPKRSALKSSAYGNESPTINAGLAVGEDPLDLPGSPAQTVAIPLLRPRERPPAVASKRDAICASVNANGPRIAVVPPSKSPSQVRDVRACARRDRAGTLGGKTSGSPHPSPLVAPLAAFTAFSALPTSVTSSPLQLEGAGGATSMRARSGSLAGDLMSFGVQSNRQPLARRVAGGSDLLRKGQSPEEKGGSEEFDVCIAPLTEQEALTTGVKHDVLPDSAYAAMMGCSSVRAMREYISHDFGTARTTDGSLAMPAANSQGAIGRGRGEGALGRGLPLKGRAESLSVASKPQSYRELVASSQESGVVHSLPRLSTSAFDGTLSRAVCSPDISSSYSPRTARACAPSSPHAPRLPSSARSAAAVPTRRALAMAYRVGGSSSPLSPFSSSTRHSFEQPSRWNASLASPFSMGSARASTTVGVLEGIAQREHQRRKRGEHRQSHE